MGYDKEFENDMDKNVSKIWDGLYVKKNYPWKGQSIPSDILNEFIFKFNKKSLILDYGCGDGLFSKIFYESGFNVISSDISLEALNLVKETCPHIDVFQTSHPDFFKKNNYLFDGLFVWGVLHHIDNNLWTDYLKTFKDILKPGGYLFIGGHTNKNKQFDKGFRSSPNTGLMSYAIDNLDDLGEKVGFKIEKEGLFDFEEATTKKKIKLKYFLLKN